jgi:hypothetical protein
MSLGGNPRDYIVSEPADQRKAPRSKQHGPQKLEITYVDPASGEKTCGASLWDFSEGGLGMDAPRHFEPGQEIRIQARLTGSVFSMHLDARARVAYCRRSESRTYRVGVAFLEHSLRRVDS